MIASVIFAIDETLTQGRKLFKYFKYTCACTNGVLFRTRMYKMYVQETYQCYKHEVDIHEAGDKLRL